MFFGLKLACNVKMLKSDQFDKDFSTKAVLKLYKPKSKNTSEKGKKTLYVYCFNTPVGRVLSAADDCHLYIFMFEGCPNLKKKFPLICDKLGIHEIIEKRNKILSKLEEELLAYFDGKLQKFIVPIKFIGTKFHQCIWTKLMDLPYGSTHSYSDFAMSLGYKSGHARAIGNACRSNSLLILVPCHRMVAAGCRGGYNSGTDRKDWLITHEKKHS